jgi:hypothetical protein
MGAAGSLKPSVKGSAPHPQQRRQVGARDNAINRWSSWSNANDPGGWLQRSDGSLQGL